jgi:hypothetical protein
MSLPLGGELSAPPRRRHRRRKIQQAPYLFVSACLRVYAFITRPGTCTCVCAVVASDRSFERCRRQHTGRDRKRGAEPAAIACVKRSDRA